MRKITPLSALPITPRYDDNNNPPSKTAAGPFDAVKMDTKPTQNTQHNTKLLEQVVISKKNEFVAILCENEEFNTNYFHREKANSALSEYYNHLEPGIAREAVYFALYTANFNEKTSPLLEDNYSLYLRTLSRTEPLQKISKLTTNGGGSTFLYKNLSGQCFVVVVDFEMAKKFTTSSTVKAAAEAVKAAKDILDLAEAGAAEAGVGSGYY